MEWFLIALEQVIVKDANMRQVARDLPPTVTMDFMIDGDCVRLILPSLRVRP